MLSFANIIWGARCGKSARRVLLGETSSSDHAHSVRGARESVALRQAPHGLPSSRLVSTIPLDLWVDQWRRKQAKGDVIIVRYADDAVLGFERRDEAERFLVQLRERLAKFGLELHPEKTRLIEFGRYAAKSRRARGQGKPETFDFLGFTHICGTTRKTGRFIVRRKTIGKRMSAKLKEIRAELKKRRHQSNADTVKWLRSVVRGYFQYHAIPDNQRLLDAFRQDVLRKWLHQLRRRSQRSRWTWERFMERLGVLLPEVRVLHPYPNVRFDAKYPR